MRYSAATSSPSEVSVGANGLMVAAELGSALAAGTSVPALLEMLKGQLKWILPAAYVSLCLVEDDGVSYRVVEPDGDERVVPLSEGLVGWALRHNTPLDIPDLQDEARLPPNVGGIALHRGHGSLLVLPLRAGGRVLGSLTIGSSRLRAYAETDHGMINLVVMQVAAALSSVLAFQEMDGVSSVVAGMARAVEARDPYTHGHAERVTHYALQLSNACRQGESMSALLALAGPLHDVGKIGVCDSVLLKPDRLTGEEFAEIQRHPVIGDEICRPLRSLRRLRPAIRHHHERYDGTGYPGGLAGEAIPAEARLLAIADAYDAMTSDRSYRSGMPHHQALAIIAANHGPQWDPAFAATFVRLFHRAGA